MSDVYVYSTLTADQEYCEWINSQIEGNPPTMGHSIIIKGGANLVTGELGWDGYHPNLYTPSGVVTRISKDDAEFLKRNPIFQIHEKKGFVRIDKKEIPVEKAVSNLEDRSPDAPDTPADFKPLPDEQANGIDGIMVNTRMPQHEANRAIIRR